MDMDWIKLGGFLLTIVGMAVTAIWGYAKLTGKVNNHTVDISKNDQRIRKELNQQVERDDRRFTSIEDTVDKLVENRSAHDKRLTQIEEQTKHITKTVDVLANDSKQIMRQLTEVATTIATKKD